MIYDQIATVLRQIAFILERSAYSENASNGSDQGASKTDRNQQTLADSDGPISARDLLETEAREQRTAPSVIGLTPPPPAELLALEREYPGLVETAPRPSEMITSDIPNPALDHGYTDEEYRFEPAPDPVITYGIAGELSRMDYEV